MPAIGVYNGGDHEWFGRQVGTDRLPIIHTTADWQIDCLEQDMTSGATSLMVVIPVNVEGTQALVMAETSLNAWMLAAGALAALHREEVGQPGWAVMSDELRALLIPRYAEAVRRVVNVDEARSLELAELLIDGLSAGAPIDDP